MRPKRRDFISAQAAQKDDRAGIPPRRAALYALARQIHEQAQMDAHQRRVCRAAQKLRALRDELWEKHGEIVLAEAVREVFHKWM